MYAVNYGFSVDHKRPFGNKINVVTFKGKARYNQVTIDHSV